MVNEYRDLVENYCRDNKVRLTVHDYFNVENGFTIKISYIERHHILKDLCCYANSWQSAWEWCEAHPILSEDKKFVREWVDKTECCYIIFCDTKFTINRKNDFDFMVWFLKDDWAGARKFCETYESRIHDHDTAWIQALREEIERLKRKVRKSDD